MSGETGQQFATKADLAQLAAQMATKAEVQDLELKLREQMLGLNPRRPGSARQVSDFKRSLNRHPVAASVVAGVLGIVLVRDEELAAWLQEVVPRFFA